MFYVENEAALQLENEARLGIARDNAAGRKPFSSDEDLGIHYAG